MATKLNYTPNRAAVSLATRRTKLVGVLMSDLRNTHIAALFMAIEEVLQSHGYTLICHDGDQQLTLAVQRVNVFLFKPNLHAPVLQLANRGEAIDSVAGKTADRFCDNQVNLSGERIRDHPLETLTALGVDRRDPLVRKYIDHAVLAVV